MRGLFWRREREIEATGEYRYSPPAEPRRDPANVELRYNLLDRLTGAGWTEKFNGDVGEAAEDTAARGLEELYWRAMTDLANRGGRHAYELIRRRPEDGDQLMTGELADVLGRPDDTWSALLRRAERTARQYPAMIGELTAALGWGWYEPGDEPDDHQALVEEAANLRRQRDQLEAALGELAAEAVPDHSRFVDPDMYLTRDELIAKARSLSMGPVGRAAVEDLVSAVESDAPKAILQSLAAEVTRDALSTPEQA